MTDADLAAHLAETAGRLLLEVRASGLFSAKALGKANAAPRSEFYMDLLCLPVERSVVLELFAPLTPADLLSERMSQARENITGLWRESLRTLGLRKIRQSVVREDNAQTRGLIKTVHHLVTVEEV